MSEGCEGEGMKSRGLRGAVADKVHADACARLRDNEARLLFEKADLRYGVGSMFSVQRLASVTFRV